VLAVLLTKIEKEKESGMINITKTRYDADMEKVETICFEVQGTFKGFRQQLLALGGWTLDDRASDTCGFMSKETSDGGYISLLVVHSHAYEQSLAAMLCDMDG
jgi:hypothetical protein